MQKRLILARETTGFKGSMLYHVILISLALGHIATGINVILDWFDSAGIWTSKLLRYADGYLAGSWSVARLCSGNLKDHIRMVCPEGTEPIAV